MVRELTTILRGWADDPAVLAVLLRGSAREASDGKQPVTHFCAGGDIRFMHDAALAGHAAVEDFFTEEYALDHLIHVHPKPTIAWLTAPLYAVCQGALMGAVSALLEASYPGIVRQAVFMTFGVFAMMLFLYKIRALQATPGFVKGVIAATGAIFLCYLVSWIAMLFNSSMMSRSRRRATTGNH